MSEIVYPRILDLKSLLAKKSFFLFGPRATGKSYLIRKQFDGSHVLKINLLKSDYFLDLQRRPQGLFELLTPATRIVIIDEVQKIPALLDEVHFLIEEKKIRFLLTGSSARKLRHGHANLLAGRAREAHLFPLCYPEFSKFNLETVLLNGGLPSVCSSDEPNEDLRAYVQTYLYEEIQAEGIVRKIPQFSRFLQTAALRNGKLINFSKVGQDAQISPSTVREYYSILEDTLLGFFVTPFTRTNKHRALQTSKFYLFDRGVQRTIAGIKSLDRFSDLYGEAFEHWFALELRAYLSYRRKSDELRFWQSAHQHEVDFIIGDHTAIEVKSTRKIVSDDLRGLRALKSEKIFKHHFLVSQDPTPKAIEGITCIPWQTFIKQLWADEVF